MNEDEEHEPNGQQPQQPPIWGGLIPPNPAEDDAEDWQTLPSDSHPDIDALWEDLDHLETASGNTNWDEENPRSLRFNKDGDPAGTTLDKVPRLLGGPRPSTSPEKPAGQTAPANSQCGTFDDSLRFNRRYCISQGFAKQRLVDKVRDDRVLQDSSSTQPPGSRVLVPRYHRLRRRESSTSGKRLVQPNLLERRAPGVLERGSEQTSTLVQLNSPAVLSRSPPPPCNNRDRPPPTEPQGGPSRNNRQPTFDVRTAAIFRNIGVPPTAE
ncbi:MAG: hypothetical protein M1823_006281 [Watsoniomyces obsoletus]|nr:MAG: hypothetical protein M1823_006281 [Watsoniomyces obsoletus]